ncbi:MAG: hypothetical protein ACLFVT_00865 [Syntrophobacteria bacterium]
MKKGLIVYLTNSAQVPETFDAEEAMACLALPCDRAVLAAAAEGFRSVEEALHLLLSRGMQHVSCVKARLNEVGTIELFGEPLRLCG